MRVRNNNFIYLLIGIACYLVIASPVAANPVYVAQGEGAYIPVSQYGGSCWYFQIAGGINSQFGTQYYGIPSITDLMGNTFCPVTENMSGTMVLEQYDLVYAYPEMVNEFTNMTLPDVSWQGNNIHSVLSANAPINEAGKTPPMIEKDLIALINKDGMDGIEDHSVVIQRPFITVTHMEDLGGVVQVSGTTNLGDGDPITVEVDPPAHYAMHDSDKFTFYSAVNRTDVEMLGTWYCNMFLPIEQMPSGLHTVNISADGISTSVMFPVAERLNGSYVPPQFINYFANGTMEPVIVTVTVPVPYPVDVWHTATPTPPITDALNETINYPYSPGAIVPEWIGLICLVLIAGMVLWKNYKRK